MIESAVDIQNLTFHYPDGHTALNGIDLRIQQGEKIALVGPNGAGKSTLLLHFNGILTGKGQVKICGLDPTRENLPRIRALVGLVFQSPDDQLFSPTVFDDVAFGPIYQGLSEKEVRERVDRALEAVHMTEYIRRTSHHLSTGEKKRIAIATVLSMKPEILVLDEPTAGLDPRARRALINLLAELPLTMVVATHDLAMVRDLLPRTVIVDQGRVAADGASSQILHDEPLLVAHGLELI
jgi:cobalt/nickel transport system ATP-binding protein